jgi:hypothetical protein
MGPTSVAQMLQVLSDYITTPKSVLFSSNDIYMGRVLLKLGSYFSLPSTVPLFAGKIKRTVFVFLSEGFLDSLIRGLFGPNQAD